MKTVSLTLNGRVVVFGPLLASTIRDHKAALSRALASECTRIEELDLTVTLATASARRVDPDMTEALMADLVDNDNAPLVFQAAWTLTVPDPLPGESLAGSPSS